jgi:hypothetical protein
MSRFIKKKILLYKSMWKEYGTVAGRCPARCRDPRTSTVMM